MGGCCSGGAGGAAAKKEASTTTYSGDKTTSSVQISPILSGSKSGSVESQRHSLLSVLVPREFSYKEITAATHRFAKDRIIGHGGSGTVYRGTVDGGGGTVEIPVAVKAITADSARAMKEYLSEIAIISSIRHRHLVKLYGWCHEGGLFLVYEYFRNGSLEQFLHGGGNKYRELPWSRRFEILKGVGSALQYLHNECDRAIIHRDVKSSNVLLDENYMAKLGDFGLSRQIGHGESGVQTMVVAGTEGYVAPEVFLTGKITLESEMFSYGALIAEVVCGRRPRDEDLNLRHRYRFSQLLGWIKDLYNEGRLLDCVDPRLYEAGFDEEQATGALLVAIACSRENPKSRLTVKEAVDFLGDVKPLEALLAMGGGQRGFSTPGRRSQRPPLYT